MKKLISLGELIDRTWETYRDDFPGLMSISAWILVTALISIIALSFFPSASKLQNILIGSSQFTGTESLGTILVIVNKIIIAPVIGLWVFTSLVAYVQKALKSNRKDVKTAMREGVRYFFPTLYVTILFSLLLIGAIMIGILPAIGMDFIAEYFGASGAIVTLKNLLILTGIIISAVVFLRWVIYYSLSGYAVIMDDARGIKAFKRSRELVQGRYWSVVLRLVAPKLLFLGISAIALVALGYIANIFVAAVAGLNLDIQLRLSTMTSDIFPVIVSVLINPLVLITDMLLYHNLEDVPATTDVTHQKEDTMKPTTP